MSELELMVEPREETGKNVNRRLRASGWIPAVVYGGGKDSVAIKVQKVNFLDMIRQGSEHGVFLLKLGDSGKSRHTMIRQVETDPVTRRVIHVDFQRVIMDEKIRVEVPVELIGEAEGVKNQAGVLDFVTRDIPIECLPGDIPQGLQYDISDLEVGDHAELGDIELPAGVELAIEADRVLCSIAHARVEEEEEEEEEFLIEAEADEPEVIGKGGGEDEEADEDEEG